MRQVFYIMAGLALLGCAVTPDAAPEKASKKVGLSAQSLAPGECGLFIWTADSKRRFIIFSQAGKRTGIWNRGDDDIPLSISDQSGAPAQQQFPAAQYETNTGIKLFVNLQNREPINDGTRFKAGTLKITDADQWERVEPIVGLSACQSR